MSKDRKDVPRTMENCFADDLRCDDCGSLFKGRALIWVWGEHTACSRVCVERARQKGEAEYLEKQKDDL